MKHYYSERAGGKGRRKLISAFLRGVGVEFVTMPGVFSPHRVDPGTQLLIEHAVVPERGVILDVGCGYGAIGVTLAKAHSGLEVWMVDSNRDAVKLARLNARINGVEDRVRVLHGDLYEPLPPSMVFDAILSNPPLSAGMELVGRLVEEAPGRLRTGGTLQLVVWRMHGLVADKLREVFGDYEVLASRRGYRVMLARKP